VYGYPIKPLLRRVQLELKDEIERLTALNIKAINLVARGLAVD